MSEAKYPKGKHPNSLANLKTGIGGRPKIFESEGKRQRSISITDTGWEGIKLAAKESGCKSVSEFLEKWGRGEVKISA